MSLSFSTPATSSVREPESSTWWLLLGNVPLAHPEAGWEALPKGVHTGSHGPLGASSGAVLHGHHTPKASQLVSIHIAVWLQDLWSEPPGKSPQAERFGYPSPNAVTYSNKSLAMFIDFVGHEFR